MIGISIAFLLLLALIGKSLCIIFRYIKKIITYREWLTDFIKLFVQKRSFRKTIKIMLKSIWRNKYNIRTNVFTAKLHSILANTGIVKSVDEIEREYIDKYYFLIREYLFGNIIYKALIIFIGFGIYSFLLQPFLIHRALGLKLTDILVYLIKLLGIINDNSTADLF
jgi:hypothetical protein